MTHTPTLDWQEKLSTEFEQALGRELENKQAVIDKFSISQLAEREHIISAGDEWRDIYFVRDGLIRVYYIDHTGNELTQHFYQSGEVISPLEDPQGARCPFYIQALEKTTVVLADYAELHNPGFKNTEWVELELYYIKKIFLKNAKHEAQLLLGNAESRYSWFCREYPNLHQKLTQNQIASFLGVTPVTISRIKNSLEPANNKQP